MDDAEYIGAGAERDGTEEMISAPRDPGTTGKAARQKGRSSGNQAIRYKVKDVLPYFDREQSGLRDGDHSEVE